MKINDIRIPSFISSRYSGKILDWVESKSVPNNSYIESLRHARFRTQRDAEESLNLKLPIGDERISFLSFRMIEAFRIEQYGKLYEGLIHLFPNLRGYSVYKQSFKSYFSDMGKSISSGGWTLLGTIYTGQKPSGPENLFYMPALFDEVDFIDVKLHKALPSLMIISLDVFLSKQANENLQKVQIKKYLPDTLIEFISIYGKFIGTSNSTSFQKQETELINYQNNIRTRIENALLPYICGEFMERSPEIPKLPAIGVFTLNNNSTHEDSNIWFPKRKYWLESYGFYLRIGAYANEKLAFIWGHRAQYTDGSFPNRILIYYENFLSKLEAKQFGNNNKLAIYNCINHEFMDYIALRITLHELLILGVKNVENFRLEIFTIMESRNTNPKNFRHLLQLFQKLQSLTQNYERLILEYDQYNKYLDGLLEFSIAPNLSFIRYGSNYEENAESLDESINNRMSDLRDELMLHIRFLNQNFSTYIQSINIKEAFKLQNSTFWVSIIALLIAILSLLDFGSK